MGNESQIYAIDCTKKTAFRMMIDIIALMHIKTGLVAVESIETGELKPVTKDASFS